MAEHVYFRTIDPDGEDSFAEIIRRLPSKGSPLAVLDIGCGVGALGLYLHQHQGHQVDGIDLDNHQLPEAKSAYRRLIQADLEQVDLTQIFAGERYDAIILADVLEHLRDPLTVLRQAKQLLRPQGNLYLVLPNVTFIGVLAGLCLGQFTYRDRGLLDRTHLRFFDRAAAEQLVAAAGLHLAEFARIESDLMYTEFGPAALDHLSPAVRRFLLGQAEALTYQFLLVAQSHSEQAAAPQVPPPAKLKLQYVMQFFWGDSQGQFDENASTFAQAELEAEQQTIRVTIPHQPQPLGAIRWDPSDRPGALDIYAVRLLGPEGTCLWALQDPFYTIPAPNNLILSGDPQGPWQAFLTNEDPSMRLPIPQETLHNLPPNSQLEVTVSWPRSPDWIALAARHQQTTTKLSALSQEEQSLAAHYLALQREKAALETAVAAQQQALQDLQSELHHLQKSFSWRVTRPLRTVRNILRRIAF